MADKNYIEELKERGKKSHVYTKFQLIGLEIANLLDDQKHIAIYMKLCKNKNLETLLAIARDIADRKTIENKGGYFMKVLQSKFPKPTKIKTTIKRKNIKILEH